MSSLYRYRWTNFAVSKIMRRLASHLETTGLNESHSYTASRQRFVLIRFRDLTEPLLYFLICSAD